MVDIGTLDRLVCDELEKVESAKDFAVATWRQPRDESGANWNAHVTSFRTNGSATTGPPAVVSKLRAAFELKGN